MGKPTGQMQEQTQKYLDDYNLLYNWDYNEMCRFIHNYSEEEFVEHYETYNRLCDDYGTELVENFGLYFDLDASQFENFEDMYQGQYTSGAEFAETIASDCGYVSRDMPHWIEIDWEKTWDKALSYDTQN